MLRYLRARTGTFGLARTPIRLAALNSQSPIRIQHVKLRETRLPSFKRMTINALGIVAVFYVWERVFAGPLAKIELPQPTKEEEEDMSEPLFIPVLGTTHLQPPRPYRGSDPEWQEFVKFSKDVPLQNHVRQDLAQLVTRAVASNPGVKLRAGEDMKVRRYWLDIDFPRGPPAEYMRSGIEIGNDYIAWTSKPVDPLTVYQIQQAVWPVQNVMAFFSFFKVLATGAVDSTLVAVGLKSPTPPPLTIEDLLAKRHALLQSVKKVTEVDKSDTGKGPLATFRTGSAEANDSSAVGRLESVLGASKEEGGKQATWKRTQETLSSQFKTPIQTFKARWFKGMNGSKPHPPRGSVVVSGFVEVESKKSWIVLDVVAFWDPKTRQYDKRSMTVALRRLQAKEVAPLRS